jgi:HSP20 family protein
MYNNIFKKDPFDSLFERFDNLDRLMNHTFGKDRYDHSQWIDQLWKWTEADGKYTISKDVPGVTKDDLRVEIDNSTIHINAKTDTRDYKFIISAPTDVDTDSLVANLKDGVLTLSVNKSKPADSNRKSIPIK